MNGAENEVTGLSGFDCHRDCLEVAQLADEHNIGIFAQRRAQRVLERSRVNADVTLRDQALLALVDELDRIFDGDHVIRASAVDQVDQRAESRRLSRASRTGDEHEPLGQVTETLNLSGDSHFFHCNNCSRNRAEHPTRALAVAERVAAEAR